MESAKNKKASKSSTLSVSSGINRPPSVNKEAFELASTKKKKLLDKWSVLAYIFK